MSDERARRPDERVFQAHLEGGPFQSGVDRGRWRLVSVDWPHAVIAVSAAERKSGPAEYVFRFELTNYPKAEPTAQLWDPDKGALLEDGLWPGGNNRVSEAFNPGWGPKAIYLPCDRTAIHGHDGWRSQHPAMLWSATSDITFYLRLLHDLLHSPDYSGVRCPPS